MDSNSSALPNNIEAEQAYLGILINDISTLSSVSRYPLPNDFYLERNRLIAQVIYDLSDKGKQVDIISVVEILRVNKLLEKVGDIAYLSQISDMGLSSQNLEFYVSLIIEKSQRRSIIKHAQDMLMQAKDESVELNTLIEHSEKSILSITDREQGEYYQKAGDYLKEFVEEVRRRMRLYKPGEYFGITSEFPQLDNLLTGFHKGELIILAARASMGKTAFTLNLINTIAIEKQVPTGFFSLEMSGIDIVSRIISLRTGIHGNKFRKNMLSNGDIKNIMQNVGNKFSMPLYISDVPSMNLFDLRVQARRLVAKEKVEIIFIDYLGLIGYQGENSASGKNYNMPRFEKISEISKSLKSLARELQIPIVVLAQLNRDAEDKVPSLANIRDSGAVEQDADVVMMLHRKRGESETSLMIAKQRNGPVGDISMEFTPSSMSFKESAHRPTDES